MKHTMKKLLCMALAIMLLVSAVPVFAAADENNNAPPAAPANQTVSGTGTEGGTGTGTGTEGGTGTENTPALFSTGTTGTSGATSYRVSAIMLDADNGNAQIGGSYNGTLDATTKLSEVAYEGFASYIDETLYSYTYKMNGAAANWNSTLTAGTGGAVEVTIYRSRIKYTVTLKLNGSTKADVPIQVNANETIDLNAKFSSNGLTADSGYYIQYYTKGDGAEHISLNYKITENNTVIVGWQTRLDNVQNPAPSTPSGGSNNNTGSSSGSGSGSGTGTVAKFKATFLNVNGLEFYSEYVPANNTITASADFLNTSVGTRDGYEHIGWKASNGSTKTTSVVLTDRINSNVTYSPIFRSTNGSTWVPGSGSGTGTGNVPSGSGGSTNKFPYPVYLNIYKDTLVGSPDKRVEITNGIALDGLVSLDEVKTVVKNYYNAKDSDGIKYDGLYIAAGNWVAEYVADTSKYDSIDAGSMRQTGTVYINVMITNAKAKSSSTADSSNPKTGDTIFVPVMVMGVTASALAAAYVFGKKRIAR